ncbi:uncharacterized protein TNCV_599371 [Trichonephila clavipes]|nr:uncharacterized protein TNCV_599371 [Trichonephila clavipes]
MRPLEDVDKNWWAETDFSVMMTYDPHASVRHDHSQTADTAKFTLVPTATLSANHAYTHCRARLQWCLARSGWNQADWGRTVFSDESGFQLCPDDHRRRVWRRPGPRADPAFTIARHTGPQLGDAYQTLLWPARSPDTSPIEHVWDMMGRRLHLLGNVDNLTDNWSKFGKKYRRRQTGRYDTTSGRKNCTDLRSNYHRTRDAHVVYPMAVQDIPQGVGPLCRYGMQAGGLLGASRMVYGHQNTAQRTETRLKRRHSFVIRRTRVVVYLYAALSKEDEVMFIIALTVYAAANVIVPCERILDVLRTCSFPVHDVVVRFCTADLTICLPSPALIIWRRSCLPFSLTLSNLLIANS